MMNEAQVQLLNRIAFPVEKRAIYLQDDRQGQLNLFGDEEETTFRRVPRFHAVVDTERHTTLAIVSDRYRLMTNREALELGKQCFAQVFSQSTAEGMELFNIIMPGTRSFCHIDVLHKGHSFEVWSQDKWWPYLRITNSYNKTRALRFDLGFCRAICKNGVIYGRKSITFQYYHMRNHMAPEGRFHINFKSLKELEIRFIERLHNLKNYDIPKKYMLPLVCKALNINIKPNDLLDPKKEERFVRFRDAIANLTMRYFNEMGENGYAALNVITDYATRPNLFFSREQMVDPLQKRSGDWLSDFVDAVKNPDFTFPAYLGEFANISI